MFKCQVIILCVIFQSIISCKPQEQDLSAIDLGYDYFPNSVGSYIVYQVDSTYFGLVEEEYTYQIKELISESFADDVGQLAVKVERYYRHFGNEPWILMDVWVQKRTTTAAERVEENVRFIKLEFPIAEGGTWQGNAYNGLGDWQYKYENVNQPVDIGELEFDKALKVNQLYSINLIEENIAYEIYALGVGMVAKQFTDVEYQNGIPAGVDLRYRAIQYYHE